MGKLYEAKPAASGGTHDPGRAAAHNIRAHSLDSALLANPHSQVFPVTAVQPGTRFPQHRDEDDEDHVENAAGEETTKAAQIARPRLRGGCHRARAPGFRAGRVRRQEEAEVEEQGGKRGRPGEEGVASAS